MEPDVKHCVEVQGFAQADKPLRESYETIVRWVLLATSLLLILSGFVKKELGDSKIFIESIGFSGKDESSLITSDKDYVTGAIKSKTQNQAAA
jgi:hypothetical protein